MTEQPPETDVVPGSGNAALVAVGAHGSMRTVRWMATAACASTTMAGCMT
jgi:hypothetical protein